MDDMDRRILAQVAEGFSDRQIAREVKLSQTAVRKRRAKLAVTPAPAPVDDEDDDLTPDELARLDTAEQEQRWPRQPAPLPPDVHERLRGGLGNAGAARARLAALQQGTEALADGSGRLADGVQQLVDQTKRIGAGLRDASGYLLTLKRNASDPAMAGFYVPPQALTGDDFTRAATVFVSPDGHFVRYLIQAKLDPFSTAAMDQVDAITDTARSAQPNTALSDASISMAGFPAANRDLRDYYNLVQP
jgi:X-X-X-Leu-X-X-Gly heptad repeat protein